MDILNPIVVIIIYLKDIFAKIVGILKLVIFTIIGLIYTFITVILNFYKFVRLMMLVSLGITVALWVIAYVLAAIPFVGWALFPVAAAKAILATLATLVLIVFTVILAILTGKLFKKTKFANSAPPPPDVNKAKETMDNSR